jgi:hypothetical protein
MAGNLTGRGGENAEHLRRGRGIPAVISRRHSGGFSANAAKAGRPERVAFIRIHASHSNLLISHVRGAQNRFPLLRDMLVLC